MPSFHAVSAFLIWRISGARIMFHSSPPSTAALLSPLITGGVLGLHKLLFFLPEPSHETDLAVILSHVFIGARSGESRAAQSETYNMSCGNDRVASSVTGVPTGELL